MNETLDELLKHFVGKSRIDYFYITNITENIEDKYEFGVPSEGEEIVTVNTEVLVDNMKLDEYYPAWPMTDKQHNALLNCGYEETLLRSMSGKQAWITINTLAKQWRAKKADHAIFEECDDDWYDDCECVPDYWGCFPLF